MAIENENVEFVSCLLNYKNICANIMNESSSEKISCLFLATEFENFEIIKLLLNNSELE